MHRSPVAGPVTNLAVAVVNGLFTTSVDFGEGAFAGEARRIEIAVRTNGAGAFTSLAPRQELKATRASTICGGEGNRIWGAGDGGQTIGGGQGNYLETADSATISGGLTNVAYGEGTTIGGGVGNRNLNEATYSTIPGGANALPRSYGQMAYASGAFEQTGDAQTSVYVSRGQTTDDTQTELFLDGTAQRMAVSTNSTWSFDILVTGRASNGNSAGYQIRGVIKNVGGVTSLVGSLRETSLAEDVPGWDATVVVDDTHDALTVKVTGAASTSVRWVASIRTVEVGY